MPEKEFVCTAYYIIKNSFGVASFGCGHVSVMSEATILKTTCPVCAEIKVKIEAACKNCHAASIAREKYR